MSEPTKIPDSFMYGEPVTRKPGDFRRKGENGPPIVASATRTRQPKGNKAELIAKCEQRGINIPAGATVAQLKELLGPEPMDEIYGRPSGFGGALENSYNLIKWKERQVAAGILIISDQPLSVLEMVDHTDRDALDRLVNDAHDAAGSSLAADRGTHIHLLTEAFDRG